MKGELWRWLRNRSQDFIVLMGFVELVILALHIILMVQKNPQGWTMAALRIVNIILLIAFSIWFVANTIAAKQGKIQGDAFDTLVLGMVVVAFLGTFLPAFFSAYVPVWVLWTIPVLHTLLGITWQGFRFLLAFSGHE